MSQTVEQPKKSLVGQSGAGEVSDAVAKELPTNTRGPIRLGAWALAIGLGGFLIWAAWAPLDEGVVAHATVVVENKRKTIQHFSGGTVKRVAVSEGQVVRAGEVLVEIDDSVARASYESVRQTYLAQRAAESRLQSEQAERATIDFHADVVAAATDPVARQHMVAQTQLFQVRRSALQAEMSAYTESINGYQAQAEGMVAQLAARRQQAVAQSEQLKNIRALAAEGYAPRNQMLQLEQAQAELQGSTAELQAAIQRNRLAIAETRMRMAARRQEYHKEEGAQLAEIRREVQAGQERLLAASQELSRTRLTAPVDGQVVGLSLGSLGGVVSPGQRLMDIVPKGEALLIDARVPTYAIDRVSVGDKTEIRFTSFANSPSLVLDAKIVTLGTDAVSEQVGDQVSTYYLARVQVTPEGLKQLGRRTLQPGMSAEVLIKTGERSLLTYLLHPLTKRVASSMKEE